jgi:hypothetical protein
VSPSISCEEKEEEKPLTQKRVLHIFLPLTLNLGFVTLTVPFIQWALCLHRDPELVLSIFSFCFAVGIVNHSPIFCFNRVTASLLEQYSHFLKISRTVLLLAFFPSSFYLLVVYTDSGYQLLQWFFSAPLGKEPFIRDFFWTMVFAPFFIANRAALEGLCIQSKETHYVGESTFIRLFVSLNVCYILGRFSALSVGYLGGITFMSGIMAESVWLAWRCRPLVQRLKNTPPLNPPKNLTTSSILSSWGQIYLSALAWTLSYPLTNRLIIEGSVDKVRQEAELAGFGVFRSLILTLGGPVYALSNTTLALYRNADDLRVLRRFGITFASLVSLLSLPFFFSAFQKGILQHLFNLEAFTLQLTYLSLFLIPFYPWLTVFRSLSEGRLLKLRFFRIFFFTSPLRLLTIYLTGISLRWLFPNISGVFQGGCCLCAGALMDWILISTCSWFKAKEEPPSTS